MLLQARHSLRLVAQMVAVAEDCADLPQHCTNLWLGAFSSDFDRAVRALLRGLGLVNESIPMTAHPDVARRTPGRTAGRSGAGTRTSASAGGSSALSSATAAVRLLPLLRRAAHLSDAKRLASSHITQGKDPTGRDALMAILRNSSYGAPLVRLHTRLQIALGAPHVKAGYRGGSGRGNDGAWQHGGGRHGGARGAHGGGSAYGGGRGSNGGRPRCVWSSRPSQKGQPGWWSSSEHVRLVVGGARANNRSAASGGAAGKSRGAGGSALLTPQACCELCRRAVDPGCLYFNWRREGLPEGQAGGAPARCSLLSSRLAFHRSMHAITGEA